jgi:hypothetical protein
VKGREFFKVATCDLGEAAQMGNKCGFIRKSRRFMLLECNGLLTSRYLAKLIAASASFVCSFQDAEVV